MGIYNNLEFPTALAYWVTYGCGGEEEFARKSARATFFRGCEWKCPRLPVLTRTIGKETDAAFLRLPFSFLRELSAVSTQHSARERLLPGTGRIQCWLSAEC